eukprot:194012-Amorphochlora_amoeboformis.AAC.1
MAEKADVLFRKQALHMLSQYPILLKRLGAENLGDLKVLTAQNSKDFGSFFLSGIPCSMTHVWCMEGVEKNCKHLRTYRV